MGTWKFVSGRGIAWDFQFYHRSFSRINDPGDSGQARLKSKQIEKEKTD
jgi:hypothetical protein